MWRMRADAIVDAMTSTAPTQPGPAASSSARGAATEASSLDPSAPPLSRSVRLAAGTSLVLAGLLNGGLQYVDHLTAGSGDQADMLAWGLAHSGVYRAVWTGIMLSSVFLLLGFLGLAQVARWRAPRLTAVAAVLTTWGMAGFANVLAGSYVANVVAPEVLGVEGAVRLVDEGYLSDWGMTVGALVPHLVGSFLGILLLVVAGWHSALPRVPLALLAGFLVWDFALAPVGVLEPHLLLLVALVWLGVFVLRMPHARLARSNG